MSSIGDGQILCRLLRSNAMLPVLPSRPRRPLPPPARCPARALLSTETASQMIISLVPLFPPSPLVGPGVPIRPDARHRLPHPLPPKQYHEPLPRMLAQSRLVAAADDEGGKSVLSATVIVTVLER